DSTRLYVRTRQHEGNKVHVCLVELRVASGSARSLVCEDGFGSTDRVYASPDRSTFLVQTVGAGTETNLTWVNPAGQRLARLSLPEVRHDNERWEVCDAVGVNDHAQALVVCGSVDLGAVVLVLDPTTQTARRTEHSYERWVSGLDVTGRLVADLKVAAAEP